MKQSQVKRGVRALLSLGGKRGSIAVTVQYLKHPKFTTTVDGKANRVELWAVSDSSDRWYVVSARQLRPLPVSDASGKVIGYAGADGGVYPPIAGKRFAGLGYVSVEPGQAIDAGDVVITTTLHRLG